MKTKKMARKTAGKVVKMKSMGMSKVLPRVAPKGKYKVGKFSNGVGVGP